MGREPGWSTRCGWQRSALLHGARGQTGPPRPLPPAAAPVPTPSALLPSHLGHSRCPRWAVDTSSLDSMPHSSSVSPVCPRVPYTALVFLRAAPPPPWWESSLHVLLASSPSLPLAPHGSWCDIWVSGSLLRLPHAGGLGGGGDQGRGLGQTPEEGCLGSAECAPPGGHTHLTRHLVPAGGAGPASPVRLAHPLGLFAPQMP